MNCIEISFPVAIWQVSGAPPFLHASSEW